MDNNHIIVTSDLVATNAPPIRRSTSRVEKGTVKVDEHQTKEEAATLLYSCMTLLDHNDENVRRSYLSHIQPKISEVVTKFGLDNDRLKNLGEDHANTLIAQAGRHDMICQAQAKVLEAKDVTDRMANAIEEDEMIYDVDPIWGELRRESGGGRSTRHGVTSKRARDEDDLEKAGRDIVEFAKRLRKHRVTSDSGSNNSSFRRQHGSQV